MDNSEVLKLVREQQWWDNVKFCLTIIITNIPTLFLLWQNYKKNRPNSKLRLIRNKAEQEKERIRSESKSAILKINEKAIKKEAEHEAELRKMEVGHEGEEQTDPFSSLKQKGTDFLKDKVGSVAGKVDLEKFAEKLGKTKKE
jgi:hypothetical protein